MISDLALVVLAFGATGVSGAMIWLLSRGGGRW